MTVNNATLAVGATQYLASLTMTNAAQASIIAPSGHRQLDDQDQRPVIDGTSLLDLKDNNLIVITRGRNSTLRRS